MCLQDLALFLKERMPTDLEELARLAEQYYEAHTQIPAIKKHTDFRFGKDKDATGFIKKCFKCGSDTHLAKNCKQVTEARRKFPVSSATGPRT